MPTGEEAAAAIAAGPVDVMVAHEGIDGGTARVESVIRNNPQGWGAEAVAYSARSRALITAVWAGVRPALMFHGHFHLADQIILSSGQRVYSLAGAGMRKNVGVLDLTDLAWKWID
jgi:hypothetical protein